MAPPITRTHAQPAEPVTVQQVQAQVQPVQPAVQKVSPAHLDIEDLETRAANFLGNTTHFLSAVRYKGLFLISLLFFCCWRNRSLSKLAAEPSWGETSASLRTGSAKPKETAVGFLGRSKPDWKATCSTCGFQGIKTFARCGYYILVLYHHFSGLMEIGWSYPQIPLVYIGIFGKMVQTVTPGSQGSDLSVPNFLVKLSPFMCSVDWKGST